MATTSTTTTPAPKRLSAQFQVLKTATQIKLRELNAHEHKLHAHYAQLLRSVGVDEDDLARLDAKPSDRDVLEKLYEGVKDLQIVQSAVHPDLEDVGGLVDFAESDPWTTQQVVKQRTQQLLREIRQRRSLWRHNKLLGTLLKESLEETQQEQEHDTEWTTLDTEKQTLAELNKDDTQQRLESYFFVTSGVSEDDVYKFLEDKVFQRREHFTEQMWDALQRELSTVRNSMRHTSEQFLKKTKVTDAEVKECIDLLLRDRHAFSDDVVAFLLDVKRSSQTQEELAHVITIELSNLSEFAWPAEGVPVHFKRGMNGRFRCHLQEEAVTLLLFQYVGLTWAKLVKRVFTPLLQKLIPNGRLPADSVEAYRRELQAEFTLAALDTSGSASGYGEDDAGEGYDGSSGSASKQDILRLLCTEARMQHILQDPESRLAPATITAVTTDLEFFGPSVSHEAVQACLRFFGVTDDMRRILANYMNIPLVFPGFSAPKKMIRGVSVGRMMSMFVAEVVLFVMDYSVRASTGIHLFRRHDDIIFYSDSEDKAVAAWEVMQEWAKVAGLKFNEEKSGSVRLNGSLSSSESASDETNFDLAPLPARPIQWGLLELRPNATVAISQDKVMAFAEEMVDRLRAAKSVFGWINVYNKYMFFFLRNFGGVSPVFGMTHADAMVETVQKIHKQAFSKSNGDVLVYLRDRIASGHAAEAGLEQIPAAWAQWPLELGGLGLYNPFLALWAQKKSLYDFLVTFHSRHEETWSKKKKDWPWREPFTTSQRDLLSEYKQFVEKVNESRLKTVYETTNTMDWFLYTKSEDAPDNNRPREARERKEKFGDSFEVRTLEEYLKVVNVAPKSFLRDEFKQCVGEATTSPPTGNKSSTQEKAEGLLDGAKVSTAYWKWNAFMFSAQVMEEFGTLSFFTRELLPAQLIDTIKKTTVSWE
ncbi:hypothetical protein Poli38472_002836 [Pythium oligandrum]|uniref:Reverse transcriptase domain-containing protein n=1 Tax=Pythium oligandrum TaxID=41045 RepID=A0A8K1FC83_PYTOL|nr:hypothetical protein Poli38472_002836 [Pythium oligandrum]|eukprot:TMW56911.1 hypothetical protein Poli38472_002836 [Pythium oligandrum]